MVNVHVVTSTSLNLTVALQNANIVTETIHTGEQTRLYLNEAFDLVKKEQATSIYELAKKTFELYRSSYHPDKLNIAKAILDALEKQIEPSPTAEKTYKFIQILKPQMEKERLKELPDFLTRVCRIKERLQMEGEFLQREILAMRGRKYMNQVWVKVNCDKTLEEGVTYNNYALKDIQLASIFFDMCNTTEGLAFIARFPHAFKVNPYTKEFEGINNSFFSPEENEALCIYINYFSDFPKQSTNQLASLFYETSQAKQNIQKAKEVDNALKQVFNKTFNRGFIESIFPSLNRLFNHLVKQDPNMDPQSSIYVNSFASRYKINQELWEKMNDLHNIYAKACEEFLELRKKYFPGQAVHQWPFRTSPSLPEELPRELPRSDEFLSMPLPELPPFTKEEFLESKEDLIETSKTKLKKKKKAAAKTEVHPQVFKRKPKKKAHPSPKVCSEIPDVGDITERSKEGKSDSESDADRNDDDLSPVTAPLIPVTVALAPITAPTIASKEPSTFIRRNFPYETLQLAKRVTEWRDNPSAALARPEYAWIAKSKEPQQARYEVTWKHDVRNVLPALGTEYSREYTWKQGQCYVLQAEIVDRDGCMHRGFFRATINDKGELYHFDFGSKTNILMIDAIINDKMFNEEDFPTLEAAHRDFVSKGQSECYLFENVSITVNQISIAELQEPRYGLTIRLFRQGRL